MQAELDALRERSARLDTVEEPAGEGDFVVMDYAGSIDGEPFEGGEGRDQLLELGSGRLIPGFEEQLTGAKAGEERTVERRVPGRLRRGSARRQARAVRRDRQGGQAQAPAGARRRLRLRPRGLRHARRAERGHRREAARGRRAARRRRVPRGRARRCRRRRDRRRAPGARRRARPRAVGAHAALARPSGDLQGRLPADLGQGRGGDPRGGQARRRAGAAPRGRDRSGHRGRGHPALRRRRPRRAAGFGDARGHDAREAARAPESAGRLDECARTLPSAPRSTTSPSTRTRSPPSGAAARDKLWTPDKGSS